MGARQYDPFEHAQQLGIAIKHRRSMRYNGLWVPDFRTILLRRGMTAIQERSVLTHELGHACLGHRDLHNPKQHRQANVWAVHHLIDESDFHAVRRLSSDPNVWAYELGVTLELLEVFCSLKMTQLQTFSM